MTTLELKGFLLEEHKKDRRLSFMGFFVLLGLLAVTVAVLYFFAYDFMAGVFTSIGESVQKMTGSEDTNSYYLLAFPVALIFVCIYPITIVYKLRNRPKMIDALVSKMDEGAVAQYIDQRTVYKFTVPLLRINFKFSPVEYMSINFGGKRTFDLPIRIDLVSEVKTLLSGVDEVRVDRAWGELYAETEWKEEEEHPLKSTLEFRRFIEEELSNDISQLDGEREMSKKKYVSYLIVGVLVVLALGGALFYLSAPELQLDQEYIFYGVFGACGIFYTLFYLSKTIKHKTPVIADVNGRFKTNILKRIIEFVNPNFQFVLHGHVSLPEVLETGLFESKQYIVDGNDQILGKHSGIPFQLSDLDLQYKRNFSNENEDPDQVFYGQAFIARFNKSFNTEVCLLARKRRGKSANDDKSGRLSSAWRGMLKTDIEMYTSNGYGDSIQLEDPDFMKLFKVYGHDPIETRYILTPAMMERIKELASQTNGDLFISFKNDKISVLNNSGRNNFEAGLFKSITKNDNEMLVGFHEELCNQLSIIDNLKLNVKIWKK